jgi:hypothetical protein
VAPLESVFGRRDSLAMGTLASPLLDHDRFKVDHKRFNMAAMIADGHSTLWRGISRLMQTGTPRAAEG